MNNEKSDPSIYVIPAQRESFADTLPMPIDSLLDDLKFEPTPDLIEAREVIISGLTNPDTDMSTMQSAWVQYAIITEQIAERAPEYLESQIAAIVHKALIFRDAGLYLRYAEQLDRAESVAYENHLDEVSRILMTELRTEVESLEMSPGLMIIKLRDTLSMNDLEQLRDLLDEGDDLEDMIGNAYAMILEQGEDPDEILRDLGITE